MIAAYESKLAEASQGMEELKAYVAKAAKEGKPIHDVEQSMWTRLLKIGRNMLHTYVLAQGQGDVGDTLDLPDGSTATRLPKRRKRRYMSVFGEVPIVPWAYGTRETQKILAVPLDARLQLPESPFSYLLQDWDQSFCVGESFDGTAALILKILGQKQTVRSLMHMNKAMAQEAEAFRLSQPEIPPDEEGTLMVVAADGKGIPMRRAPDTGKTQDPGRSNDPGDDQGKSQDRGSKRTRKRVACVGASYTIDPFVRTQDDILNEILRDDRKDDRPAPRNKRVRADLSFGWAEGELNGKPSLFAWLADEIDNRALDTGKPVICLMDGEKALLKVGQSYLPPNVVFILDIYHVMEKLRDAAKCFHQEGRAEAEDFVEHRLGMLLEGKVVYVVARLRQMVTKHHLKGEKRKTAVRIANYLYGNRERLRYDEYIRAGYPIGSGAVEGACRHLVKDRMERTGMHWRPEGAQAMLHLRALHLNGDWDAYCQFRRNQETERLYPYASILDDLDWADAA